MWIRVCNQRPSNCDDEKTSKQLPDDNDFAFFLHPFKTCAGLISTCVALTTVLPTRVSGSAKELQRKRWIIAVEQIMVQKELSSLLDNLEKNHSWL